MSKLIVKKKGFEGTRTMTRKSFELAGQRRGWEVVAELPNEKTEIQKLMDQKRAEKAAQATGQPTSAPVETQAVTTEQKAKRGPKPKTAQNEA